MNEKIFSSLTNNFVSLDELKEQAKEQGFYLNYLGDGEYQLEPVTDNSKK